MQRISSILLICCATIPSCKAWWKSRGISAPTRTSVSPSPAGWEPQLWTVRGGDDDAERYSRQTYTLGARAQGLIRSSTTIYLDGPPTSGLVYECAKNLALMGVRHLVLVTHDHDADRYYHDAKLDDLGKAYQRGARAELSRTEADATDEGLLVEYLQRLNPSITVSSVDYTSLLSCSNKEHKDRIVYLSMDRPYSTQVERNKMARNNGWAFVSVETAGVFGRVFCDFGPSFQVHDADGEIPLVTPLDQLVRRQDDLVDVHCVEGERHDVSKEDTIQFQLRNGDFVETHCVVTDVQNPFRFVVKVESSDKEIGKFVESTNEKAASFRRVKVLQEVPFYPIEEAFAAAKNEGSLFSACDLEKSFDSARQSASMSCFQALSAFTQREQRLPTLVDRDSFMELAREGWSSEGGERICESFLHGCAAKFTPLQAVFGAIGAQEALKAATGLYFPVRQILLYDCDEVLDMPNGEGLPECRALFAGRSEEAHCLASGLRTILGDKVVDKVQNSRVFVVGCGAIGCEVVKLLAPMGVGAGKKGKLVLTDMDTIEKSNLSRQLLFRDNDIGKFKSVAAREAALRLNPAMNVEAHSAKVGASADGPFDDVFWSNSVDIVLNALDNVSARLYMDAECVSNNKALVDAGTMGPKGNVQVVIPHQSESYACSVDPPEPSIPVCTLKNFPYAISHTIQWGRDLFDDLFQRRPEQANEILETLSSKPEESIAAELVREKGLELALEAVEELDEDLSGNSVANLRSDSQALSSHALQWSARLAAKLFAEAAVDLLEEHPLDSVDEDGEPFWSGTRRPPRVLSYSRGEDEDEADQALVNELILEFVRVGARLRVESVSGKLGGRDSQFSAEDAQGACQVAFADKISDAKGESRKSPAQIAEFLRKVTPGVERLASVDFEKDNDSNGHVAFVSAASNLRAIAYGIPPVHESETRRVAGRIIPAMVTTTAFVSALSCIEFIKLVQGKDITKHRNAFVNLALPFFAFTVPLPAETIPGVGGKEYTLWDKLTIEEGKKAAKAGGITVKSLLKQIRKLASDEPETVGVASISSGPYMLYANFLHEDDEGILGTSLWELVDDAVNSEDSSEGRDGDDEDDDGPGFVVHDGFVELTVIVEDAATGEVAELPTIRVKRYGK